MHSTSGYVLLAHGRPTIHNPLPGTVDLQRLLNRLGRHNALAARLRESLLFIARRLPFLCGTHANLPEPLQERLAILDRDIKSLAEFDAQVAQEIAFLLDSTLGLINLEQNAHHQGVHHRGYSADAADRRRSCLRHEFRTPA